MPRVVELSEPQPTTAVVDVVVGIVLNSAGEILIGRRTDGTHMAGFWEFPGGKLEPDETPFAGLKRELAEELGIEVEAAEPFIEHSFEYPDRHVRLDVWRVLAYAGMPESREGQALRWAAIAELDALPLLPADAP
ncbi:MAG: 8-oxo-dGTP diphosphatase MutT, partial [Gammaproteobacteria bacterium]